MKKLGNVLLLLVWVLLLLPFFYGAQAAHPATDDFTFAAYTHATWVQTGSILHVLKDALSYTLRTWRDWQGTITGILVMTLNPAVFSLGHYGAHAVALLILNLAAWLIFLHHVMRTRMQLSWGALVPVYLALSACLLVFLPDMVEGIYWFNGAWFYMGAQALALIALVLCDRFSVTQAEGWRKKAYAALCGALLLALGMDNYITAMMTAAALAAMAAMRAFAMVKTPLKVVAGVQMETWEEHVYGGPEEAAQQKTAARRTALLLIPIAVGLLISVLAPGNSVRMAADGAHESGAGYLGLSIVRTLWAAACYMTRFLFKTPLTIVLCLLTPTLCRAIERVPVRRGYRVPAIPVLALGVYAILCAMIIPHMYASGNAGSGRVINMYHCYVLLAVPVAWMMALIRLRPETRRHMCEPVWLGRYAAAIAVCALACIWGGQIGSYEKLVSDQLDGTQDAYIAQFEHEYALCEAAGEEDDVELPAWTVQTVTGKMTAYEDASVWTNESMAQYFGVKSVRCVPAE